MHQALGIDLPQIAAALATGGLPSLEPARQKAAAIQFAYPATSGVLQRLAFPPGINQLPTVERTVLSHTPGTPVTAPPHSTLSDRLAHWVVLGESAAECRTLLNQVARHLDVSITAPARVTSCAR
ncbi:hypothetical protein ACJ6WF_06375 [Streptomyces sp. MMS24-I2-30]|uniref:hypothetical protein n=1 Tax=Streptomyces sp. MMS24-I2-30 TaxID=3351564 RepID=UPI003896B9B2